MFLQNLDLSAELMPCFEKIKEAGLPPGGSIILLTNNCMRTVMEKKGVTESSTLQKQIDVFLKEFMDDQNSPTPGITCSSCYLFSVSRQGLEQIGRGGVCSISHLR